MCNHLLTPGNMWVSLCAQLHETTRAQATFLHPAQAERACVRAYVPHCPNIGLPESGDAERPKDSSTEDTGWFLGYGTSSFWVGAAAAAAAAAATPPSVWFQFEKLLKEFSFQSPCCFYTLHNFRTIATKGHVVLNDCIKKDRSPGCLPIPQQTRRLPA